MIKIVIYQNKKNIQKIKLLLEYELLSYRICSNFKIKIRLIRMLELESYFKFN